MDTVVLLMLIWIFRTLTPNTLWSTALNTTSKSYPISIFMVSTHQTQQVPT